MNPLDSNLLQDMYRTMVRIRQTEERIASLVESREIKTPCHLCIGQEAIAAGVCANLIDGDYVWGGHRSHGHYLARGGNLTSMLAEIFGKATGCSKGRGGSMHLFAQEVGILGTVPIVAATIPLAVGAALASKLRNESSVSVSFFGDGAMEEGHFHESMNLAAIYNLPVLFVCENNFYASHLALHERRRADNLYQTADSHGIPSLRLDGNDVSEVYASARTAVERARGGLGPTLLEYRTYRWRGHVGASWDEDVGVKRRSELEEWLPADPIRRAAEALIALGVDSRFFADVERTVLAEIDEAVRVARSAPEPIETELLQHVFV
jgi:TPP-dependent pyruvate/acetoin dehydrogenase alpha subunit